VPGGVTNSLLIITGGMGAGNTTILGEASDILALRHVAHAAIDLDALGLTFLPSAGVGNDIMYRNVRAVSENYAALGIQRFLLARAMENSRELEICREAVSATNTVVCRLTSSIQTMRQRMQMRETGISQHDYVARAAKLNAILDLARLEGFHVTNENRSITDVAGEVLVRAGWIQRDHLP
jgi:hypothetical protein